MKYWANLDKDKNVIKAIVLSDDKESEWLTSRFDGEWIEYTEENPAAIGGFYDEATNFFVPPNHFWSEAKNDWILAED